MRKELLRALAESFVIGESSFEAIVARVETTLGQAHKWMPLIVRRFLHEFEGRTRPRRREVIEFLRKDRRFRRAWAAYWKSISVQRHVLEPSAMQPVAAAQSWDLPRIESSGELADWLWLTPSELDWYADLKGLNRGGKLSHYHYRVVKKSSGVRLIESPKENLKGIQKRILIGILNRVPAHEVSHGFVRGRSIRTFTAPHAGRQAVLKMDLRDFFPTFSGVRIQAFFRTLGYPESVADLLGGLCTNTTPKNACLPEIRNLYSRAHLPQGAPTSPALANACMYRVDCRLAGYAQAAGVAYTRYADDLAFSGDFRANDFAIRVAAILQEEGFSVAHRKTRVMRQGVRQYLAGLAVNQHPNVVRNDYDRLKAILMNCLRTGWQEQNRELHPDFRAHLLGRISFVGSIHLTRGKKLRAIFDRIPW